MSALSRSPVALLGLALVLAMGLIALLAPVLPLPSPTATSILDTYLPPSAEHWFGTDALGRDVLARTFWGARSSLAIGLGIVVIGMVLGVSLGLAAAEAAGSLFEELAMRLVDIFAAIPVLIWAIAVVGIVGTGATQIGPVSLSNEAKLVLLVGVLFFPGIARITYGLALAELKQEYVDARRLPGTGSAAILFGDVLPNILSPLLVQASVLVGIGIIIEASLSFVGLGVQPPMPSWGSMLADSKQTVFSGEYWLSLFPGLAIFLSVIGFNLLGDGLRDLFDPRRRTRLPKETA
ncbi:ABC transporter permease [Pararhodobacter aggregans]|uniref:ABC transporter permease n=1 Tax=Pararhodobacter aggregans TaxID=404875 RepID=A0A2T7UMA5_9RHOB|nr:ABC transporter permease [Pararhodobacter aggregans]PTX00026.1 peptide/nickel transport system permease protein [Pararhodobacter aggregans]PVE45779.1 ABC transporter permease [Pararhodobacter aggregans]